MEAIVRFRSSGYEGYGIQSGETVVETGSLEAETRGGTHRLAEVTLLAPCLPSKIVCVGRNYVDHAKELGNQPPAEPMIFLKPPSSIIAGGEAIVYPKLTTNLHFEGELGVVIGKRGRHVAEADAMDIVYGYTCVNDVTARDLQRKDGQWTRGKGFDTFCPFGPVIVPRDRVRLEDVRVRTLLDGEVKQDAPVSDMIFSVPFVIAFVTAFLTLEPGDLIATGTPAGVGSMFPGQVVTVEVSTVGTLSNPIVAE
ncbi:MAG: fumarylacetoacetate hydrolase family protein [Bryobacteraceae bacterium]